MKKASKGAGHAKADELLPHYDFTAAVGGTHYRKYREGINIRILETPRLFLREYTIADLANLHAIQSDPITMAHWQSPFTLENSQAWMERAIASYAKNSFGRYAVILRESDKQIGDFGIMRVMVNGVEENDLGYILHHPYWHQGYATEGAKALLQFGFQTTGMDRIVANMAHDNVPSRRVAERIGMKKEGEFFNPRNRDMLTFLYAISASDYDALNS